MPTNPDPDLMRIFDFTTADLEANRSGKMSERQIVRLTSRHTNGQWLSKIGCAVVSILAILFSISSSSKDGITSFFIIVIVGAIPITFIYLGVMDRHSDLSKGKIEVSEGQLFVSATREKWGMTYSLLTTKFHTGLTEDMYAAITEYLSSYRKDMRFRLYYAPNSNEFLSIEVTDKI